MRLPERPSMLPQQAHVHGCTECGYRYHSAAELLRGAGRFVNVQERALLWQLEQPITVQDLRQRVHVIALG